MKTQIKCPDESIAEIDLEGSTETNLKGVSFSNKIDSSENDTVYPTIIVGNNCTYKIKRHSIKELIEAAKKLEY